MTSAAEITGNADRAAALYELWRRNGSAVWLTLEGGSMLPELPPGSRIRLDCSRREFTIGQVVGALHGSRLVIHRLIRIEIRGELGPRYVCQGDANPREDPPLAPGQLVGVVQEWRPPSPLLRLRRALRRRMGSGAPGPKVGR